MNFTIPEKFLRNDDPVPLFEIAGVSVAVRLLPANRAEAWSDRARAVDDIDMDIEAQAKLFGAASGARDKAAGAGDGAGFIMATAEFDRIKDGIRALQKRRWDSILALLKEYDPDVFKEEILGIATAGQLSAAFLILKGYNDPFVVTRSLLEEFIKTILPANGLGIPARR